MTKIVDVSAIHLWTDGIKVYVDVEIDGHWRRAITESAGAPFSHIAEANGSANWKLVTQRDFTE